MRNCATEAQEQQTVVEYCDLRHIPIFHVPNGGKRNAREAYNLKRQGVKPGVPDLFIPVANEQYHGLFIEMKRKNGGSMTAAQCEWQQLLRKQGYKAITCHGASEAIEIVEMYLRK